ncbi:uncharacterized protein LOC117090832 [Trachypithecus francoisi]|uniref:uncharacterized protein LOC117090832 n=1 Tax=Trachypithecus francoisi TaxID=54180 RepID=UPI00141BE198|nr:uncharacterized protein LOC117090832 [Trachypithecus francoisi]
MAIDYGQNSWTVRIHQRKCEVSRERSEGGGGGGKPRSSAWTGLLRGAAPPAVLTSGPEAASSHRPSSLEERALSRAPAAREAGSPTPTPTSPTPRKPDAAGAVRGRRQTEAGAVTGDGGSGGAGMRSRRRSWRALGRLRDPQSFRGRKIEPQALASGRQSDARRWSAKPVSLSSGPHSVSRRFPSFRASASLFPTLFESLKW